MTNVFVWRVGRTHAVTAKGPESTAWLLPLTGTVGGYVSLTATLGGDMSANNRASSVTAWPEALFACVVLHGVPPGS